MSGTKYSKAPISELILGIIFNSDILLKNGLIFGLLQEFIADDYSEIQTVPAAPDEDMIENSMRVNMDFTKTGYTLYRLYSKDKYFLVQIQHNCILLNWIRRDDIAVGNYPGFSAVMNRFNKIIETVIKKFKSDKDLQDLDISKQIKRLSLTYHDRVSMDIFEKETNPIARVLNFSFPELNSETYPQFIGSRYIYPCKELNGINILNVNTGMDQNRKKILAIENKIKGDLTSNDIHGWFETAHKLQLAFFQKLFTKEILASWK